MDYLRDLFQLSSGFVWRKQEKILISLTIQSVVLLLLLRCEDNVPCKHKLNTIFLVICILRVDEKHRNQDFRIACLIIQFVFVIYIL